MTCLWYNNTIMTRSAPFSILNSTEYVEIAGIKNIPAKVDTGADSSALWASDIKMKKDGRLTFMMFAPDHPLYTGSSIMTRQYKAKSVRSSHGDQQIRYQVELPITIGGHTFVTNFTLADRSQNHFPVLIGRRTIKRKFLVDVSKSVVKRPSNVHSARLNKELKNNPHKFHKKYIERRSLP